MKFYFHVLDTDRGYKTLRKLKNAEGGEVRVGLVGVRAAADHPPGGGTVAEVGLAHEYGTERAPERSFIRRTLDANSRKYKKLQADLAALVLDGKMTPIQALEILGSTVAADMRATVEGGVPPPLAASTIRRGRTDPPLIETKQLLDALGYTVVTRRSERTHYPEGGSK